MLTKTLLLQSITSIGMAIGALTTPFTMAQANPSIPSNGQGIVIKQLVPTSNAKPRRYSRSIALGAKVETISGAAEIALAEHLAANGAKFYGAYWCSHCQKQKSMFGATAVTKLPYVECAKEAENSQRQLCKDKKIEMFPTWVINGKYLTGTRELKEIADLTGYTGPTDFKFHK
jgi:glutaredoxin